MKNTITILFFSVLSFTTSLKAQISTGSGGAINILSNSPITNTNVGIGTNTPTARLTIESLPDGQTFMNPQEMESKCELISVGKILKVMDYPVSNYYPKSFSIFSIADRSGMERLSLISQKEGFTAFQLGDKNNNPFFHIYDNGNGSIMQFIKSDSRLMIGGLGAYEPGHKLYVKGGSAKIEGNILTDANIGIGTSSFTDGSDTYRLSIKGKVRAEEIKVYNTWADYVFTPNYKLPNLKQVENYIAQNGHLPNVPSAKQITEKGLELGEMAKIQQEKIEELTLYMIQQNKEIEQQQKEIEILKAENQNYKLLAERIASLEKKFKNKL